MLSHESRLFLHLQHYLLRATHFHSLECTIFLSSR
nr:MAG TPA_asm: hypothetical protein [Caudoviricetes sp.]